MPRVKAKDSQEIETTRKRLEKRINAEKKHFNDDKIKQVKNKMHKELERHSEERIDLKEKVKLFDENQHPAPIQSKSILQEFARLNQEQKKSPPKTFSAKDLSSN